MPFSPKEASSSTPAPRQHWWTGGASLLAVGVQSVEGEFGRREAVRLLSADGRELGRGLSTLSSGELRELMGRAGVEVVHRDQLVITRG